MHTPDTLTALAHDVRMRGRDNVFSDGTLSELLLHVASQMQTLHTENECMAASLKNHAASHLCFVKHQGRATLEPPLITASIRNATQAEIDSLDARMSQAPTPTQEDQGAAAWAAFAEKCRQRASSDRVLTSSMRAYAGSLMYATPADSDYHKAAALLIEGAAKIEELAQRLRAALGVTE